MSLGIEESPIPGRFRSLTFAPFVVTPLQYSGGSSPAQCFPNFASFSRQESRNAASDASSPEGSSAGGLAFPDSVPEGVGLERQAPIVSDANT